MKTEKEIIEKINELKREAKLISKIMEKPQTDFYVWVSLDYDLTECKIEIEMLKWVLNK